MISTSRCGATLHAPALALLVCLTTACGDDAAAPLVPERVTASGATTFTGVVGQPLSTSPAVLVTTGAGEPVPSVDVTFAVASGGGEVITSTVPTNAQGIARVGAWVLGPQPGTNRLTATVAGLAPVTFEATAAAGPAAGLERVSGDAQHGDLGSPLPDPLVVRVLDRFGNPVSGANVSFAVTAGAGTLADATVTSDHSGAARTSLTLTQPGAAVVAASLSGVPGGVVTFQADTGPTLVGEVSVPAGVPRPFSGAAVGPLAGAGPFRAPSGDAPGARATELTPSDYAARLDPSSRLIVTFRPSAFALPAAPDAYGEAAAREAAVEAYSRALAPLVESGSIVQRAVSPAIAAALVTVEPGRSREQVMAQLRADPRVAAVEPDGVAYALHAGRREIPVLALAAASARAAASRLLGAAPATERYTTDPLAAPQLWHYAMVDAPRTWVEQTGSRDVRVAIVDTGIRGDHPALAGVLASSGHYDFTDGVTVAYPEPQPVCGGLGSFQTVRGRPQDLALPRNIAQDPLQVFIADDFATCWTPDPLGSHGTHVAGTVASTANDDVGGTGLNWNASLISVRVLGVTGSGFLFDVAQGILYAGGLPATYTGAPLGTTVQMEPADVMNVSIGTTQQSTVLANAVRVASANTLIVVSAGNTSGTADGRYPASYPEVMAVTALDPAYGLASYANVGGPVDVAAPGGDYRQGPTGGVASSTWNYQTGQPNYAYYQGTSMAAPHVTGVAALVKAAHPALGPEQLRTRIEQGAVDLGAPGRDDRFGAGVVNAYNSVTGTAGPAAATTVRLVDVATGAVARTADVGADGRFVFANVPAGDYFVVGGQDEGGDGLHGVPGRRFGWLGGARMTPVSFADPGIRNVSLRLSVPAESEPNDDRAAAQPLVVDSWVAGVAGGADARDTYRLVVPAAGAYTFETSGVVGACGYALELDTVLRLLSVDGVLIAESDDVSFPRPGSPTGTASYPGTLCSRISRTLQPGTYFLEVTPSGFSSGTYRLHVKAGS